MPAPKEDLLGQLNFKVLKVTDKKGNLKYVAECGKCKKQLTNTAIQRLKGHNRVCNPDKNENDDNRSQSRQSPLRRNLESKKELLENGALDVVGPELDDMDEYAVDNDLLEGDYIVSSDGSLINAPIPPKRQKLQNAFEHLMNKSKRLSCSNSPTTSSLSVASVISSTSSNTSAPSSCSVNISCEDSVSNIGKTKPQRKAIKRPGMAKYIDSISDEEIDSIDTALAEFFFGCNIPLSIIESTYFKNFCNRLRPAYKVPTRKTLSTTLLDKSYERCLQESKHNIDDDAVLIVDGWKNMSTNTKLVVTMLHCANGEKAFLQSFDFSSIPESGDNLVEVVNQSKEKVTELYNANIYAVVSDNASPMLKMGRTVEEWHVNCSSHTGNLCAKDFVNKEISDQVLAVLKEFKHPNLEKRLLENGGRKVATLGETRWCSMRDCFSNYQFNRKPMLKVITENENLTIKPHVQATLIDHNFNTTVNNYIELFNPICKLINNCQRSDYSIADSAASWLKLELPTAFLNDDHLKTVLKNRKKMGLNKYSLTAFYLNPKYKKDAELLTGDMMKEINVFLIETLKSNYGDVQKYVSQKEIFGTLFNNNVTDPIAFWRAAQPFHPELSKLAIRLMKVPSSSAQLERVFSNWGWIHDKLRNRLTDIRSEKLVYVYYTLKIRDRNPSSDYVLNSD